MTEIVLAVLIAAAFASDVRTMRIPNWLTVGGAGCGLALQSFLFGWQGAWGSVLGLLTGFGIVLLLHAVGAVGAGDVKLFGAIGALSSVPFVLSALTYSILYAACIGIIVLVVKRKLLTTVRFAAVSVSMLVAFKDSQVISRWKRGTAMHFPFMLAVAPGSVTAYFLGL
ncbi:prepilin peptidase [Paenibacillus chartarius]|uniref:Prepilin peptidase n=1 Tax=Paenibacillus chartarius TaxID=747481 RepID=A0ABV6DPV4_9BACL